MQTTYGFYQGEGFPGLLYDTGFTDKMSYSAEGGSILFGAPVELGTDPARQVKASTGANAIGIAVRSLAMETAEGGDPAYAVTETVSVLKRGRIWVRTFDAVVAGAPALIAADGTFTDGTGTASTKFSAVFVTGNAAAGLAVIEVNPK